MAVMVRCGMDRKVRNWLGSHGELCQGEALTGWLRSGVAVMGRYVAVRMATAGIGPEWQSGFVQYRNGMVRRGRYLIFLSGPDLKGTQ